MSLSFIHDGSLGDITYSLACVLGFCKKYNTKGKFYLRIDQPHTPGNIHPLGNILLTREWAERWIPLLKAQPWCEEAAIYDNQPIDVNLNAFRYMGLDLGRGDIAQWLFWTYPESYYDLSQPYLWVEPDETYKDTIVVNRTCRYRNPKISFDFLKKYKNLVFLGLEPEYRAFSKHVPGVPHIQAKDFLEMARIIAGSKLYVGNQSFGFSLASALGVKRCLEVCLSCPNCIIHGPNGRDAVTQQGMETIVEEMYGGA